MKRILTISLALIISLLLTACSGGVEFSKAMVNNPIPDAFKKRTVYPGYVAGYNFHDLVGSIISVEDSADPVRIGLIRPNDITPAPILIVNPNNYYRSRIQKGAEINGSYLMFAANFKSDDMAELTLSDIAYSEILFDNTNKWDDFTKKAIQWVTDHPKQLPSVKRLWVKSAVLSRQVYQTFSKIEADAKGQVGDVIGVNTGVYNKSENETRSVVIAFDYFDIDKLVEQVKVNDVVVKAVSEDKKGNIEINQVVSTPNIDKILDDSRSTIILTGKLKL